MINVVLAKKAVRLCSILARLPVSLPILVVKHKAKGHSFSAIFPELLRLKRKTHVPLVGSYIWSPKAEEAVELLRRIQKESHPRSYLFAQAAKRIAIWHHARQDFEGALAELNAVQCKGGKVTKELALLKSQLYLRLGQREEATKQVSPFLEKSPCANTRLVRASCASAASEKLEFINGIFDSHGLSRVALDTSLPGPMFAQLKGTVRPAQKHGLGKVSVIFPIYNAEDRIYAAVRSILNQTYADIELLLVDDQSTDDTFDRINDLAKSDARVIALRCSENGGAYKARNFGLRYASGDFITTHDADDWSHPEKIERHLKAFHDHPSLVATGSYWVRSDENLEFKSWHLGAELLRISYPSFMIRARVIKDLGAWDDVRVSGDSEFIFRVTKHYGSKRVKWIDKQAPLAFSLAVDTSLTNQKSTHVASTRHGLRRYYHEIYTHQWRNGTALSPSAQQDRIRLVPPELKGDKSSARRYALSMVGDCRSPTVGRQMLDLYSPDAGPIAITHVPEVHRNRKYPEAFCDEFFQLIEKDNVFIAHDPDDIVAQSRSHLLSEFASPSASA